MDPKSLLKNAGLFHDFNPLELLKVTEISKRLFLPKGDTIINEGENFESDSSLYILSSGAVKITTSVGRGMEQVLAILSPPDTFGEISFTDHMPRTANVTALSDTELLVIDHDGLVGLLAEDRTLALKFYRSMSRVLAGKLRAMNKKSLEGFEKVRP